MTTKPPTFSLDLYSSTEGDLQFICSCVCSHRTRASGLNYCAVYCLSLQLIFPRFSVIFRFLSTLHHQRFFLLAKGLTFSL